VARRGDGGATARDPQAASVAAAAAGWAVLSARVPAAVVTRSQPDRQDPDGQPGQEALGQSS